MITTLKAVVLGIVQGLTEFIPVSSSGHLVLVPKLFGWSDPGLAFDVVLHLGTLLAVLAYFRKEWVTVIRGFFTSLAVRPSEWDGSQRLAWLLILATIPAAVAGAALSGFFDDHLRSAASVAAFLAVGSLAILAAELWSKRPRTFEDIRARDAGAMGILQVVALAPGMSRSGITMSAGMFSGIDREAAARFSFMMSAPVIAGAGVVEAVKVARQGFGGVTAGMLIAGFVTSAVVGFLTVKYLLRYLRRGSLAPFAIYGLAVAAAVFLLLILS